MHDFGPTCEYKIAAEDGRDCTGGEIWGIGYAVRLTFGKPLKAMQSHGKDLGGISRRRTLKSII